MKETFIVLIAVGSTLDARPLCNRIENSVFDLDNVNSWNVKKEICNELELDAETQDVEVWSLTDFMERVNDEEFNPDDYFMSYVHAVYDDGPQIDGIPNGETMSDTDD